MHGWDHMGHVHQFSLGAGDQGNYASSLHGISTLHVPCCQQLIAWVARKRDEHCHMVQLYPPLHQVLVRQLEEHPMLTVMLAHQLYHRCSYIPGHQWAVTSDWNPRCSCQRTLEYVWARDGSEGVNPFTGQAAATELRAVSLNPEQ